MTEVPAATPETTPAEVTVATEVVAETQGLEEAAVPDPVSVVVAPIQAVKVPEIIGAAGCVIITLILEILPVLDLTYIMYVPAVNDEKVESDTYVVPSLLQVKGRVALLAVNLI